MQTESRMEGVGRGRQEGRDGTGPQRGKMKGSAGGAVTAAHGVSVQCHPCTLEWQGARVFMESLTPGKLLCLGVCYSGLQEHNGIC